MFELTKKIAGDRILPHLLVDNRWILVLALCAIASIPNLVKEFFGYENLKESISDPFSWIPSLALLLTSLSVYTFLRFIRPADGSFVVAVMGFFPVSEGAGDAADNITDQVARELESSLDPSSRLVRIKERIDPDSIGRDVAMTRARNHRANVAVCGVVREDLEELLIEPTLLIVDDQPYKAWVPADLPGPKRTTNPHGQRIDFRTTKARETRDLVLQICAVEHMYHGRYGEAIAAFYETQDFTIGSLTLLGIAYLKESRFAEAFRSFDSIVEVRPDSFDAWALRAYAAKRNGDNEAFRVSNGRLQELLASKRQRYLPDLLVRETVTQTTAQMALELAKESIKALEENQKNIQRTAEDIEHFAENKAVSDRAFSLIRKAEKALSDGDLEQVLAKASLAREAVVELPDGDPSRDHWMPPILALRALALTKLGRPDEAVKALSRIGSSAKGGNPLIVARAFASVADKRKALQWLEQALDDEPTHGLILEYVAPEFDDLSEDEDFRAIVDRGR